MLATGGAGTGRQHHPRRSRVGPRCAPAGADTEPGGDWKALLAEWARRQLDAGAADIHADARRDFDQVLLQAALDHADGHRGEAAARLGVGRNTLTRKLKPGQSRR